MDTSGIARRLSRRCGMFAVALTLVACGGGGGGGGGTTSGVSYTGVTTQATVTSANAATLAGGAYSTGDAGTSLAAVTAVASGDQPPVPASVKAARVLADAVAKIDFDAAPRAVGAVQQVMEGPFFGTCGGSFSYSISVDDQSGNFGGSLVFNGYCEQPGESINGTVSFSGQIDLNSGAFVSLQIAATNFSITSDSDSFVLSGTISYSFPSPSVMQVTENFNIRDTSGLVYRVQNFIVTLTDAGGATHIEISGRFYHPTHGYVDVTTAPPFVIPLGGTVPTSGRLTVAGADGGSAVLTAIGGGQYQLQVDEDGDGMFDADSTGNWTDL